MAASYVEEVLPPVLESTSAPPPLFDGTTRLYTYYPCPYAQRVWIVRNYKGLQDEIKFVPIDLQNRPAWYKEKINPKNKVPALEHNGKIIIESLDLVKYVDANFKGPSLLPDDPAKKEFAEELIAYCGTFINSLYASFRGDNTVKQAGSEFDYLETALHKFDDGPFFLGQFSQVDAVYIPFVERIQLFLDAVWKYDVTAGRPKLAKWIEEINKIDAYKATKADPKLIVERYKIRFLGLQDEIKIVPIDVEDKPAWYKEKVYSEAEVPALEHDGKIIGECVDLLKYIDANFKGPSLLPDDPAKRKFAEELIDYCATFLENLYAAYRGDNTVKQAGCELDQLEIALNKFDDGPFFLGQFSQVDAVYAPFIERGQLFLDDDWKHDITAGRPKLAKWIEEINKIDAYKPTKSDPKLALERYRSRFLGRN